MKHSGERRAKLDKHHFTGIFIEYTATDHNIRYIDLNTKRVKTSHHAIFDKVWYLQQLRPPAAQLLYDLGIRSETDLVEPIPAPAKECFAHYPPCGPPDGVMTDNAAARMNLLPLQESI